MKLFVRFFLAICFLQLSFIGSMQAYSNSGNAASKSPYLSLAEQYTYKGNVVFGKALQFNALPDTKADIIDIDVEDREHEEEEDHEHFPDFSKYTSAENYFLALFNVLLRDPSSVSVNYSLSQSGLVSINTVRRHVRLCVFRV